mgnify:CR=1 FL=1
MALKKHNKPVVKEASKRTRKKVDKALEKRSQNLSYLNPNKMAQAISGYGYKPSAKSLAIWYVGYAAISIGCASILKMNTIYIILMLAIGILFMPGLIVRSFYNKNENQRFSDVNIYMEQMLYSFRVHSMVFPALCDLELQFTDGKMRDCIIKAKEYMLNPKKSDDDPTKTALKFIEDEFYCDKIVTIHRFMCNVEKLGGTYRSTIQLLLKDRSAWEKRQLQIQKDRKQKKTQVILSIAVSILICVIFTTSLPAELEIMSSPIVQIDTVVLWFFLMSLFCSADKKISQNLLASIEARSEDAQLKKYTKIVTWDDAKETKSSMIFAAGSLFVAFLLWVLFQKSWMITVGIVVAVLMLFQHKLDYRLAYKSLVDDIRLAFPRWMIEISLLLQTESVQVALIKSYNDAPGILKPELELLMERLKEAPDSSAPFIDFFGDFALKDVQSAMKMLYSNQACTGGDPDTQIADIIERNNQMLEVTEVQIADNALASLDSMFLMPLMICAAKLMIDMMVFLVKSFTVFGM